MDYNNWHSYLMANRPSLPNQEADNINVASLRPDRKFSDPSKYHGGYTPDWFGGYNKPDKRLSCCKANGCK